MSDPVLESPAVEPPPPAEPPPVEATLPDDDAGIAAALEAQAIDVPDGDKLVPLSAVTKLREKLKDAKAGSAEAAALKQQLEQTQQQLQAVSPLAEAFRAMQHAHQEAPPQPPPPAEDTTELDEIARDFDFYKADGQPDLVRAKKHQERETKRATAIAEQVTAPLVQQTLRQQAESNIARARVTTHPVTKQAVDPQILDVLIARIEQQPNGLQTLANPDAMKHLWLNAYALSSLSAQPLAPPTTPQAQTPPVVTERAGGLVPESAPAMTERERRAAKEAGLSPKEFLDLAKGMKW